MEPDLRDGQGCRAEVSPRAGEQGAQAVGREKFLIS